ncbi:MAG: YvcK family protein [Patescibacteria group bacterium]
MKRKICVIGGGTGSFIVLSGLKKNKNFDLTAIVSSADNGGSSKKFRDEFGILPPGDIRQCLLALSEEEDKSILRKLFTYRFDKGNGLEGHTFGNIFLTALNEISGSNLEAIRLAGKILKIKGKILPITDENIQLVAEYENKEIAFGEHAIDEPEKTHDRKLKITKLFINRKVEVYKEAKKEIENADFLICGPGDLYTSTIANFVVGDAKNIIKNSKAKIIFIINLMTKFGQTSNFSATDHVNEIVKYIDRFPDFVLINNSKLSDKILKIYLDTENATPVLDDLEENKNFKIIRADIASNQISKKAKSDILLRSLIRHDSDKIAKEIEKIISEN